MSRLSAGSIYPRAHQPWVTCWCGGRHTLLQAQDLNEPESYTCPRCGKTSWNTTDAAQGYCGNCHDWTRGE